MIQVRYSGPVRAAHTLPHELSEAGFRAEFSPPVEKRGVGQDIIHLTMHIAADAEAGLIGAAALEGVRRVVRAFNERHSGIKAETETDEDK